jgi:hypothetical protein
MPLIPPPNVGRINTGSRYASVYCRGEEDKVCLMGHIIYTENPCDLDASASDWWHGQMTIGAAYAGTHSFMFSPPPPQGQNPDGQLCFWEGGDARLIFPIFHAGIFDIISLSSNRQEIEDAIDALTDLLSGESTNSDYAGAPIESWMILQQIQRIRSLIPFEFDAPGGDPWTGSDEQLIQLGYTLLLLFGNGDGPVCPDDLKFPVDPFGSGGNPLGTKKECITIKDSMYPKEGSVTLTGNKRTTREEDCPPTVDIQWKLIPRNLTNGSTDSGKILLRAKRKPGDPFWNHPCFIDIVAHQGAPFSLGLGGIDERVPTLPSRILSRN